MGSLEIASSMAMSGGGLDSSRNAGNIFHGPDLENGIENGGHFAQIISAASQLVASRESLSQIDPIVAKYADWSQARSKAEQRPKQPSSTSQSVGDFEDVVRSRAYVANKDRKALSVATSLATRYGRLVEEGGLKDKQRIDAQSLERSNHDLGQLLNATVDRQKDGSAVEAFREILKNTADANTAPVVLDKILDYLKELGAYDKIETLEADMRDFAARSIEKSDSSFSILSRVRKERAIDQMFVMHVKRYLQKVLLSEGRVDSWETWQQRAKRIETKSITSGVISNVFDLYKLVGSKINPNYHPKFARKIATPWESSLVKEGGILAVNGEEVRTTKFKTKHSSGKDRPYIGWETARARFLIIALEGVPAQLLNRFRVDEAKYVDNRANKGVDTALHMLEYGYHEMDTLIDELRAVSIPRRKKVVSQPAHKLSKPERGPGWQSPMWRHPSTAVLFDAEGKKVAEPQIFRSKRTLEEKRIAQRKSRVLWRTLAAALLGYFF